MKHHIFHQIDGGKWGPKTLDQWAERQKIIDNSCQAIERRLNPNGKPPEGVTERRKSPDLSERMRVWAMNILEQTDHSLWQFNSSHLPDSHPNTLIRTEKRIWLEVGKTYTMHIEGRVRCHINDGTPETKAKEEEGNYQISFRIMQEEGKSITLKNTTYLGKPGYMCAVIQFRDSNGKEVRSISGGWVDVTAYKKRGYLVIPHTTVGATNTERIINPDMSKVMCAGKILSTH